MSDIVSISKLQLTNFRNFSNKKITFLKDLILLTGRNGVGKTNILESITICGKNGNLRSVEFEEMVALDSNQFAINYEFSNHQFIDKMSVLFSLENKKKNIEINGEPFNLKRQGDVKNHFFNPILLTPKIEQTFIFGKTERRNYLDRIVSDINISHNENLNKYKKLLKERLAILQKYYKSNHPSGKQWLDIVENKIVEMGIIIASSRVEAVIFFNQAIESFSSNFPKTKLKIIGEIEDDIMKKTSIELEKYYKIKLEENRQEDLNKFKTNFGVHLCDFDAIFCDKEMSATLCSTGEQKAIMISITLARAKISSLYKMQPTILIFDEIVSHLDNQRKIDLFKEIQECCIQTFLSATSKDLIPSEYLHFMQIVNL